MLACLLARGEIHDLENWGMEYWEIGFFWNGSHSSPLTGIGPAPPVSLLKLLVYFPVVSPKGRNVRERERETASRRFKFTKPPKISIHKYRYIPDKTRLKRHGIW